LFFRKAGFNIFEILILLCFVIGIGMLIFSFFGRIDRLLNIKSIDKTFLVGVLYISWAIGQFFDKKKWFNYLKAFLAYILGMITFTLLAILVGYIIDL